MRIWFTACFSALFFSIASPSAAQQTLQCEVVSVHDGDSIRVRCPGTRGTQRVRMNQIDAPELEQSFGKRARDRLRELCPPRSPVTIELQGRDQYDRLLGNVRCGNRNINEEMVAGGYAWVYDQHVKDRKLYSLQDSARREKKGLWATRDPQAPWRWRYEQRQR